MRVHTMMTDLFRLDGHSFAPGHEPTVLDWIRFYINENSELLIVIGSGLASFWVTLIVLRRIVAFVRRALRDPHAEEEAAQAALRKLAEAEAQREPRVRRRAGPGAVEPDGHAEAEGQYGGGHAALEAQGYGAQSYEAREYGTPAYESQGYESQRHGVQGQGSDGYRPEAAGHASGSGHAPRPGSFFAHRGARASR